MQRFPAALLASLSLGLAPAPFLKPDVPPTPEAEWKALRGEWVMVSMIDEGVARPVRWGAHVRAFAPGRLTIYCDGKLNNQMTLALELDKRPKRMRFGGRYLSIYKVEGDTLTECNAGGRPPPADFRPGRGACVLVFKRK